MFESLSERLQNTLGKLTKKGKLSEKDIDQAMREIRLALLEADVNYRVVKDFTKKTKEEAKGEKVMKSLSPGQMVIKIVRDQLVDLMTDENQDLIQASNPPTVVMMCGLQGAGKTTHAGKLAYYGKHKQGKNPLLVACDVYRPAAIKQLEVVGDQAGVPVFSLGTGVDPVDIAKQALAEAKKKGYNPVILDTAGRLQIDEELMEELVRIKEAVGVDETLLVVDAMTGQEAVNVAQSFNDKLDLTGIVLSKLDGDARGGAALSVKAVTGKPIKLVGTGEKLTDLEAFHPDRIVSRIMGMGDVLSLIERAEESFDREEAKKMEAKMRDLSFDLNDFYQQIQQVKQMGPLEDLLRMIPGVNSKMMAGLDLSGNELSQLEAIMTSMTPEERANPKIINASRRARIAQGSGTSPVLVNRMLKQFRESKKMMKKVRGMSKKKRGMFKNPFF